MPLKAGLMKREWASGGGRLVRSNLYMIPEVFAEQMMGVFQVDTLLAKSSRRTLACILLAWQLRQSPTGNFTTLFVGLTSDSRFIWLKNVLQILSDIWAT